MGSYKTSTSMERAAFVFAIVSIVSCLYFYISIPTGALAIIFGLLSRGGNTELGQRAKIGTTIGIVSIVFTLVIYTVAISYAFYEYGTVENIINAYSQYTGINYEDFLQLLSN